MLFLDSILVIYIFSPFSPACPDTDWNLVLIKWTPWLFRQFVSIGHVRSNLSLHCGFFPTIKIVSFMIVEEEKDQLEV